MARKRHNCPSWKPEGLLCHSPHCVIQMFPPCVVRQRGSQDVLQLRSHESSHRIQFLPIRQLTQEDLLSLPSVSHMHLCLCPRISTHLTSQVAVAVLPFHGRKLTTSHVECLLHKVPQCSVVYHQSGTLFGPNFQSSPIGKLLSPALHLLHQTKSLSFGQDWNFSHTSSDYVLFLLFP